jgi:hypothetical protein
MSGESANLDMPAELQQRIERARKDLTFERDLRERVQELHDGLAESRKKLRVDPANVRAVVEVALEMAGQPGLQESQLEGVWPAGERAGQPCPVFDLPKLTPPWDRCTRGLVHPHTKKVRPITFDHDLVAGRDDVVLVHLEHALVAMAQRILRAEVWRPQDQQLLHRVTARTTDRPIDGEMAVLAHARLVVVGRDHSVLHEELFVTGGLVKGGRFQRFATVGQVDEYAESGSLEPVNSKQQQTIARLWSDVDDPLAKALEARMKDRTKTLATRMSARGEEDVKRMTDVLEELRKNIESQIEEEQVGPTQQLLPNMSPEEKDGYQRNLTLLQQRRDAIPGEIEQESKRLRAKYSEPRPLLFPVSVTWLLPREDV